MLGAVFTTPERGAGDALLSAVARDLQARGLRLAGAVQHNLPTAPDGRCDMVLRLLPGHDTLRISQSLGPLAQGCRLDPDGLERAVAQSQAVLDQGADLLIVNKFGKQEAEGRGFRPLIAEALARGVPVLTAVAPDQAAAFARFAQDLSHPLPPDAGAVLGWVRGVTVGAGVLGPASDPRR